MGGNWKRAKLGEICSFKYGEMPKKADLTDTGYPVFSGYRIVGYSSRYHYADQEIVVVARGLGGTGDIKMSPPHCFLTNLSIALLLQSTAVDKKFLYYQLASTTLWGLRTGSAQAQITIERLKEYEIKLPPLPVQRRIAGILSTYDELIENNQRRIKILEEMARSLYREWFVNFRYPGHEKVPLVDSPRGPIPKGWEVKKLADLCSKLIDGTHDSPKPSDSGYPLVTGRHIRNGFIEFSDTYLISDDEHQKVMKRSRPEKSDIIYSNIGTLGEATIVDQNFEYSIKNVALFKPISRSYSPFLYCYLVDPASLETLRSKASGTSQKFFSLDFLRNTDIIAPPEPIIRSFAESLFPMLQCRSLLNKRNENLRRARDLLLPRLIGGSLVLEARRN
jgi:type I restriction enzyme, S subunit